MRAFMRIMTYPLVQPSLSGAAALISLICLSLFVSSGPRGGEKLWPHVAPFLVFWISLRVLLHVGNPPKSLGGSVVFALLLLTLLLGLAGIVFVVLHLWEIA